VAGFEARAEAERRAELDGHRSEEMRAAETTWLRPLYTAASPDVTGRGHDERTSIAARLWGVLTRGEWEPGDTCAKPECAKVATQRSKATQMTTLQLCSFERQPTR